MTGAPPLRLHLLLCALLCALCACEVSWSAAAAQPGHPKNAATWYLRAIEHIERLSQDERMAILNHNPADPPSAELRAALAKAGPAISMFQRGAAQDYSDFNLDFSLGIELPLPHLAQMRTIARTMMVDASIRIREGDSATAAQRFADMYRASVHFSDDGTVISSLVGSAVCALADGGVQSAMDHAAFGPAEAAMLLREVERIAGMSDPFNFIGAAAGDQELIVGWIDGVIDGPDAAERMAELIGAFDEGGERPEYVEQIASMNRETFDAAVVGFDAMTDRVIDIMMMPDGEAAKAAMEALGDDIRAGEYGPLAMLSSHWGRVLNIKQHMNETLEKRIESLRAIATEEVEPVEVANAAVWYGRAIRMLNEFPPEEIELLREFAAADEFDADVDEQTTGRKIEPMLLMSQRIIAVLREGSAMRRCDFSIIWVHVPGPAPSYTPGMRDLFRVVHADGLRLLRAEKFDEAAERFAIGYRMIAHLSGDPQVVSSIVAHRAFLEAHTILRAAFHIEGFEEVRPVVLSAFERIDVGDPFGYLASHRDLRRQLLRNAELADRDAEQRALEAAHSAEDVENVESVIPTAAEMVSRADEKAMLYYYALMQYSHQPERKTHDEEAIADAEEKERARLAALDDVLDIDELMAVRDEGPAFGERWITQGGSIFHGYEARSLNLLADRRPLARADLRLTALLLRRVAQDSEEEP